MMIRIIYTFFLGLLLALFVGLGIQAFYPQPKYPEYPKQLEPTPLLRDGATPTPTETEEQRRIREEYDQQQKEFQKTIATYNRNVSIISLVAAIILLAISLILIHKIDVISDGMLLGGVFIMLYAIGRAFGSENTQYQFLVVTIGLIIAFILGYLKFIAPQKERPKKA